MPKVLQVPKVLKMPKVVWGGKFWVDAMQGIVSGFEHHLAYKIVFGFLSVDYVDVPVALGFHQGFAVNIAEALVGAHQYIDCFYAGVGVDGDFGQYLACNSLLPEAVGIDEAGAHDGFEL